mgnify:CR=1 FL=1
MKLINLINNIEAETLNLVDPLYLDRDIKYVATSDLMSDLLALVIAPSQHMVLVTGLANGNSLRTAEMLDIHTIIYCRNKKLNEENAEMAINMQINTFSTPLPMFDVIGILYRDGLRTATRLHDET